MLVTLGKCTIDISMKSANIMKIPVQAIRIHWLKPYNSCDSIFLFFFTMKMPGLTSFALCPHAYLWVITPCNVKCA